MNPPKTDAELAERTAAFIERLVTYTKPGNIPFTPEQQGGTLNSILYQAVELRDSEPFLRASATRTLKAYTDHLTK